MGENDCGLKVAVPLSATAHAAHEGRLSPPMRTGWMHKDVIPCAWEESRSGLSDGTGDGEHGAARGMLRKARRGRGGTTGIMDGHESFCEGIPVIVCFHACRHESERKVARLLPGSGTNLCAAERISQSIHPFLLLSQEV